MSSKKAEPKEEGPSCFICLEPFTKQPNRKPVICPHCPSSRSEPACVRCIQHYISTSIEDPHCPSCRKVWTYDYICENFLKTWYNGEFKKQREAILMDRERSRLPEAQPWAERMRRAATEHKPALLEVKRRECELKNRQASIQCERVIFQNNYRFKVDSEGPQPSGIYRSTLQRLEENARTVERQIYRTTQELEMLDRLYYNMINMSDQELQQHQDYDRIQAQVRAENPNVDRATEEALIQSMIATIDYKKGQARTFTMKCPGAECRGFLSTAYKCGICERSTCAQCLIQYPIDDPKGEAHVCSEDDKKTVELIKKSCRNCPSCGMSIYRIEGCNQMFCTACNTAFDWASGQILNTRQIHNPHYTDYLRRSGGGAETDAPVNYNPCNQNEPMGVAVFGRNYINPINYVVDYIFYSAKGEELEKKKEYIYYINHVAEVVRLTTHIRNEELRNLQNDIPTGVTNQKLNAEYLAGKHSQEVWKKKIMENDVKRLAYNEAIQSYEAFNAVCGDLYANFVHRYNETLTVIPNHFNELFIRGEVHKIQSAIRRYLKNNEKDSLIETIDSFIEHYKQLTLETKELIEILNKKMVAIIKTYKVKMNCYKELVSANGHVYYQEIRSSYTGLQKATKSRISRRPAPSAGASAAPDTDSSDYDTEDD